MTDLSRKHADGVAKWGLAGAVAAAVGASVCCLGPLLLLALGVGGAWIGNLTAMEKYRPIWTAATLVFLGLAFARVYRKPKGDACASGSTCPPNAGRRNKVLLWIVTALVLALLALPYAIPYAFAGGPEKPPATRQTVLSLRNMTCSACTVTVKKSLTRVDGVKDAKVNGERLVDATTRAGFPSTIVNHEGGTRR